VSSGVGDGVGRGVEASFAAAGWPGSGSGGLSPASPLSSGSSGGAVSVGTRAVCPFTLDQSIRRVQPFKRLVASVPSRSRCWFSSRTGKSRKREQESPGQEKLFG